MTIDEFKVAVREVEERYSGEYKVTVVVTLKSGRKIIRDSEEIVCEEHPVMLRGQGVSSENPPSLHVFDEICNDIDSIDGYESNGKKNIPPSKGTFYRGGA